MHDASFHPVPALPLHFPSTRRDLARLHSVVVEHTPFVVRNLRRFGVPSADVDDAVQDVFVVAARRLNDFPEHQERAFLYGTATRVASTRARGRRRHHEQPDEAIERVPGREPSPEQLAELGSAWRLLERTLSRMSPGVRRVFELTVLDELPAENVARLLEVPEGTVRSRLQRARSMLRLRFGAAGLREARQATPPLLRP